MIKIGIIEEIHQDGIDLLKNNKNFSYEVITDTSDENLKKKLPEFDAISLRVKKISNDIYVLAKKLKVISRHGVGYDNVDTQYLKNNNIVLLITATANALTVAEHVMYMMLSIAKGNFKHHLETQKGNFNKNAKKIQTIELYKKKMLIAGFGRIGKNLIKRCLGFDMEVNVFDPFINANEIKKYGGTKVEDFNQALEENDFISLHMPLNDKTRNLVNYQNLKTMKKNAIIVNTARGGIINEQELDKALNENLIFGAGLDVFEQEPTDPNNPLLKNEKVLLTPHVAALTEECKSRMAKETIQNIIDFFENKLDKSKQIKL